jgi:hypothetical protein
VKRVLRDINTGKGKVRKIKTDWGYPVCFKLPPSVFLVFVGLDASVGPVEQSAVAETSHSPWGGRMFLWDPPNTGGD